MRPPTWTCGNRRQACRMVAMPKDTAPLPTNKLPCGLGGFTQGKCNPAIQFIPQNKLDGQDIRRSTLR